MTPPMAFQIAQNHLERAPKPRAQGSKRESAPLALQEERERSRDRNGGDHALLLASFKNLQCVLWVPGPRDGAKTESIRGM